MTKPVYLLVSVVLFAFSAFAQQESGDIELGLQGQFFSTVGTGISVSAGNIVGKVGGYVSDNFEIGISPTISITSFSGTTTTTFGSGVFVIYSFLVSNSTTVPYVGAQYFKQDFDNSDDNGFAGVQGGVKFFLSKKSAFDINANYLFTLNEKQEGGLVLIGFGFSYIL